MPGICYFQINTPNPAKANAFYGQLFGWDIKRKDAPYEYWEFSTQSAPPLSSIEAALTEHCDWDEQAAKKMGVEIDVSKKLPGLLVYFDTDDVDATLEKVKALGGSIVMGKMAIPGEGYMAVACDDQGVVFGLWKVDKQAANDRLDHLK